MIVDGVGLVLEGGGMRCVFTAGVLDYFMDHDIEFPYVAGVSGGACAAACYLSHQRGRQKKIFIDFFKRFKIISLSQFFTKGAVFDLDLAVDRISKKILPFDFDAFFANPVEREFVASNCNTGEAVYFDERQSRQRLIDICKASCAVPVVTKKQFIDGVQMLDGGVCDPVPIKRAISKGYKRNIVVLTRNPHRRSPYTNLPIPLGIYGTAITKKMRHRGRDYNNLMQFIEAKAETGEVLVLQPLKRLKVTSIEKDTDRLLELYEEGYECAKAIHAYLGI